jgi:sortase A
MLSRSALRWSRSSLAARSTLVLLAFCATWAVTLARTYVTGHLYQSEQARAFDAALARQAPLGAAAPAASAVPVASAVPAAPVVAKAVVPDRVTPEVEAEEPQADPLLVGRIQIPRLGISAIVREGEDADTLRKAVGHIPGTALPGASGNVGLAAHRDTYFRPLKDIRKGDLIRVATLSGRHEYRVESTEIVTPADVRVLDPTREPSLTLVTCYPFYYVGPAPKRFIVHAVALHATPETQASQQSTAPPVS